MMRWFLGFTSLLLIACLLIGSPPVRAATVSSPLNDIDEHPWDFLKHAYRVEILVITSNYILFAVWYSREQVQPTIIRVDLQRETASGSSKSRAKNSFIFTE